MNVQEYKLLLYVVTNDGDDWERPNALVIPTNSRDSKITLADIRRVFPLPGTYHFRTKYTYGNGFVWLDITKEDVVLQSFNNVFYMKVLRICGDPNSNLFDKKPDLLPENKNIETDFDLI